MAGLPILKFEEKILETVEKSPVAVIIGETGSGKSTQLSQILHRRGYTKRGIIAVTQPRRVAAVSVARRVALELGVQLGEEVGYAIRFEDRTSEKTCIKYLTDGCLLRESLSSMDLAQYSVIILDEAHERSLNTDILLGLMKRLVKMRSSNLKVLITSATLDGVKVSEFFSGCPVLNIPGTLFPVEKLYSRERPTNYIESSLKTALDIHTLEPPGDILIFMTGKDDIEKMVTKLEERILNLEDGSCMDALVMPLHGSLPPEMQIRVFSPAPPNCRRIIVATNIAETSLTVDGVVYVIDSGYVKQRHYNPSTGMYSLDVVQISRVQADQRAGRAGRTQPGKCYRLYPVSAYHEEFLDATVPEIQRSSLAGTVLYLKSLDLLDIDILHFDFLDPPSRESLEDALRQLYLTDAIDENGLITEVGQRMAELPLEPSLSRTLIEANDLGCLAQALTVVAMLSAEINLNATWSKGNQKKRKTHVSSLPDGSGWGDHIQLLQVYESWVQEGYSPNWCKDNDLQVRGMMFAKDVRKQLCQIMQKRAKGIWTRRRSPTSGGQIIGSTSSDLTKLHTPLQSQKGSIDLHIFQNSPQSLWKSPAPVDVDSNPRQRGMEQHYWNLRKALCKGYGNQLAERMLHHNGYRTIGFRSQLVQVHPSSVLQTDEDGRLPDYVVYHELIATPHPFMRNVCSVEMSWVMPILKKLEKLNVHKLSGYFASSEEQGRGDLSMDSSNKRMSADKDVDGKIQAARERYLARKAKKT